MIDAHRQCVNHRIFFNSLRDIEPEKISTKDLLQFWQGIIDNYSHSVAYFRSSQEEPTRRIVEKLMRKISQDEASDLLISAELDEINKEEVAWEQLVRDGFTKEKGLAHLANFPWLFQNGLTYDDTIVKLEQR